jgi:hypothetical protein
MEDPGYIDYLKAAFRWRTRVPGMGRMPLNQLGLATFAVLGLANPGFWFLGAAAEVAYLLWLSTSDRFQAVVRGQRLLADKQSYAARVQAAMSRLSEASQQRYRRLLDECQRIVGISQGLADDASEPLRSLRGSGLNQLLWIFLRLLNSREVLNENISSVDRGLIEREIQKLEARIGAAADDPALLRSLTGTVEIRRKRLDNLEKAERSRQVIDAELERIEQQVVLIREEAAVGGKADMLSARLDSVSSTLIETNSWMEQNAEIFGELGADPLGSAPADLPEIPAAMETEG